MDPPTQVRKVNDFSGNESDNKDENGSDECDEYDEYNDDDGNEDHFGDSSSDECDNGDENEYEYESWFVVLEEVAPKKSTFEKYQNAECINN